jgi:hypothetical protein
MMGNRMPQKSRNRKSALAALCAAFGIALIVASSTVAFAGDDDDDELWDVKIVRKLFRGFGLRNGQEAGIEYKERPGLVLPPSSDLPAPVAASSPAANNPAWPTDPDVKKRADERRVKRDVKARMLDQMDGGSAGDSLKPRELEAGRTDKPAVKTTNMDDKSPEMTPSQLGWTNGMWGGMVGLGKSFTGEKVVETKTFVREPSRGALTDPPSGYRTPSPAQPYGINSAPDRDKAKNKDHQTSQ